MYLYCIALWVLQVFSIVVFGCIANQGWDRDHCFHSQDISRGVCDYGTAIGVMAFLLLLVFLVVDAFFDNMSNVQLRKYMVIADIMCSGKFLCFYLYQGLVGCCICFTLLARLLKKL